jgi:predicted 2-oxoglutarate/Fe(II)-dependent dioxygenase YbiX
MGNVWLEKDRSETASNRMPNRVLSNGVEVHNPALGINIYKNIFKEGRCENIINTLEKNLSGDGEHSWQGALVTEGHEEILDARNCLDFKVGQGCLGPENESNKELYSIHKESFNAIYPCVEDYGHYWGVVMRYYEVFNFVKYEGNGKHFAVHADHGPAYITTVSAVAYLNDDYDGGELVFPRFNLTIKPEPGDLAVFPSTFIYEHSSEPIVNGTKYSIVVMTDYNDRGGAKYFDYTQSDTSKVIY